MNILPLRKHKVTPRLVPFDFNFTTQHTAQLSRSEEIIRKNNERDLRPLA